MAWVRPTVEVAFTTNPGTVPGSWTDISQWCMGPMVWSYGRDAEMDQAQAGTLSLVLDNRDRRFDPLHNLGPYYGNLKPRKRIRVTASGTTLFTGFVDGWPQTYDDFARVATVELKAIDPTVFLATSKITGTPYEIEVLYDQPVAWFPLDEADTLLARNVINPNGKGIYASDGVKLNQDTTGVWSKAPFFFDAARPGGTLAVPLPAESKGFGLNLGDPMGVAGALNPQSVEFWVKLVPVAIAGLGQRDYGIALHLCSSSSNTDRIAMSDNSVVANDMNMGVSPPFKGVRGVDDGGWHHVVLTSSGGTQNIYIDGTLDATKSSANRIVYGSSLGFIGQFWGHGSMAGYFFNTVDVQRFQGYLRHIAYYDVALTAAQVSNHYNAAYGFPNDTTGDRIERVLKWVGWPNTEQVIDEGASKLQPQTEPLNGYALPYIQSIAQTERGLFFCQPDGKFRFRSRHFSAVDVNAKTVQATFGDDLSDLRYLKVKPASDELFIFNDAAVSRKGGRRFVIEDVGSIGTYFRRSLELSGLLSHSDSESEVLAQFILDLYKTPLDRIESMSFDARTTATHETLARTLRLGDRLLIKFKQMATGNQQGFTQIVEKITHRVNWSERDWSVEIVGSPIEIQNSGTYFIVGTSTVGGTDVLTF